jgi:hypothetical protein
MASIEPLRRLGRLDLSPGLRALHPDAGLVVTAMVQVPVSPPSELPHAWDVAWADAVREARRLGSDEQTAAALAPAAGSVPARGSRVVVTAHGEALLTQWLPGRADPGYVRVSPLPHLQEVAVAASRRPAHVVVLADRDGAAVIAHPDSDRQDAHRHDASLRPGMEPDPHPGRPAAHHHARRHVTDREPESGGERNAEFIAGRVADAAANAGAHIILGAGDQHILDAISRHLPPSLGPLTTIADGPVPTDSDDQLTVKIDAALDGITAKAVDAVAGLIATASAGPDPAAVRGTQAVAVQLAEQQVAVLLVAADSAPDELVWEALHQDAIVALVPDQPGPLAGEQAAALLRRGAAS